MNVRRTPADRLFSGLNYLFFAVLTVAMIYPFLYVLNFALSDPAQIEIGNSFILPAGLSLDAFRSVLRNPLTRTGFQNSLFVVVVGTAYNMVLTVSLAFPLSRRSMYGRGPYFAFMMFTMIFNGGLIPTYLVVRGFGLVNSLWALILPTGISVYNTLIMIKFFKGIPESIIESAYLDGYNDIQILIRLILPLSTAVIAAIGLFYAVFHWNNFFHGLMYINDASKWPLQTVLVDMLRSANFGEAADVSGVQTSPERLRMATAIVTIVPILFLYPFLQKYFVKGVLLGSVKG